MSGGKTFPSRVEIHRRPDREDAGARQSRVAVRGSHRSAPAKLSRWLTWGLFPGLATLAAVGLFAGAHSLWRDSLPPILTVDQALDVVHVAGTQGALPVVTLDGPIVPDGSEIRQTIFGSGREITQGNPVLLSVSSYDAKTGALLNEAGRPVLVLGHADADSVGQTLSEIVLGSAEGSRFVVARELASGATELNVVDVLPSIAQGTPVEDQTGPLQVLVGNLGLTIDHDQADPPAALTIQTFVEGSGPQVALDDDVAVQYLAVQWSDGRIISSTWDDGSPTIIDISEVMPGLREALVDQRVGSRLAVTIPPEKATGEDTLCIVVDILGVMPAIGTDSETNDE